MLTACLIMDHDTQYGLINYIAKFSLRAGSYFISDYAYSKLLDDLDFPQYRRHFSMSDLLLFKLNGA